MVEVVIDHRKTVTADPAPGGTGQQPPVDDEPTFDGPLYAARRKIYPQSVRGTFRRIKWAVLAITLAIYYFLPFVRWNRGPGAPDQAVLIDFPGRRFYFFFIEIWPQEVYFFTGLLIIAAMTLFLMNAVAGRVWCGYLCPQTVWTDLFLAIERFVEGDRRQQIQTDAGPWTAQRIARKGVKHFLWLMVAWWTGGAWVLYFADAPTLVWNLATGQAPLIAYGWIALLTFTTYTLAGHMREQVCTYMCPWPRIQAALTDEYALNVTYRYDRGEPRASVKKSEQLKLEGLPAGDCIDCRQCVNVCPTGIDIRNGSQLECIQCGLCIDACDNIMEKIGRPKRLIGYDSEINLKRRLDGQAPVQKIIRVRTVMYAAIIALVGAIMLYALLTRHAFDISVIHDRNPIFVRMADGAIRNGYTMRILNKRQEPRRFAVSVQGVPATVVEIMGLPLGSANIVEVGPDQSREFRVLVNSYEFAPPASTPIVFHILDLESREWAQTKDYFRAPERSR
ncbi:cytochrome c oxidase accessory protein CcoG [Pseudorhodoplanes sp.]|uniref:cytochrome c oxidase accessory protein CcoG n=1 Tax=Pseudorhodoplanes sp. TaxID=1934341 RepID=UPI00391AE2FB